MSTKGFYSSRLSYINIGKMSMKLEKRIEAPVGRNEHRTEQNGKISKPYKRKALTEAQRVAKSEKWRKWYQELTPEQRQMRNLRQRTQYLTPEQQNNRRERNRKRTRIARLRKSGKLSMSSKQILQDLISFFKIKDCKVIVERLHYVEENHQADINVNVDVEHVSEEDVNPITLNHTIDPIDGFDQDDQNPLLEILNQLRGKCKSDDLIINHNLVINVLKMFDFDYPDDILYHDKFSMQVFNYHIDANCLIESLNKWQNEKYAETESYSIDAPYENLYWYLQNNFNCVKEVKNSLIIEELKKCNIEQHHIMQVSCSHRQLNNLFHKRPNEFRNYFCFDSLPPLKIPDTRDHFSILNWPFISTQINLPGFSMLRKTISKLEHQLINFSNKYKPNKYESENMQLLSQPRPTTGVKYSKVFLIKYLHQLKIEIIKMSNNSQNFELIKVLTEFERDIDLCDNLIEENLIYGKNLSKYPYVRYLGYPIKEMIAERNRTDTTKYNVRLQQICQPKIFFSLIEFDGEQTEVNGDIVFEYSRLNLESLYKCVLYRCLLCNEDLGSFSLSPRIAMHMLNYHAVETNWKCVNCPQSFSTNKLSFNRWHHDCNKLPTT